MKNGLLIWNVLLTLGLGYLVIAQFTGKKKTTTEHNSVKGDTTNHNSNFRIAYFEMDSVEANFELVKDVKAELSRKENAINNELEGLSKKFQQRYNYFQSQAQGGTMTQAQSEEASNELKNMRENMDARKQTLDQEYSNFTVEKMRDIKTTIRDFLKEYNRNKNYSYIFSYGEADGLFYYKDSAYNITADVIKGLNARHKESRKQ